MTGFSSILNQNSHGLMWSGVQHLNPETLAGVPDVPGVYLLYWTGELVYIGSASKSLRDRLTDHVGNCDGDPAQPVFGFMYAAAYYPLMAEQDLLDAFRRAYGRLPRYNKRDAISRALGGL